MMFVTVSGNPTEKETEEITSLWQGSLFNANYDVQRYAVVCKGKVLLRTLVFFSFLEIFSTVDPVLFSSSINSYYFFAAMSVHITIVFLLSHFRKILVWCINIFNTYLWFAYSLASCYLMVQLFFSFSCSSLPSC